MGHGRTPAALSFTVPPPAMYTYTVEYALPMGEVNTLEASASYFVDDGTYTLLKDQDHKVVLAVRTDYIILIERGEVV